MTATTANDVTLTLGATGTEVVWGNADDSGVQGGRARESDDRAPAGRCLELRRVVAERRRHSLIGPLEPTPRVFVRDTPTASPGAGSRPLTFDPGIAYSAILNLNLRFKVWVRVRDTIGGRHEPEPELPRGDQGRGCGRRRREHHQSDDRARAARCRVHRGQHRRAGAAHERRRRQARRRAASSPAGSARAPTPRSAVVPPKTTPKRSKRPSRRRHGLRHRGRGRRHRHRRCTRRGPDRQVDRRPDHRCCRRARSRSRVVVGRARPRPASTSSKKSRHL